MRIRIGTRGSKLALAQSAWVKEKIEARHPGVQVELVRIRTTGDKILDVPLSRIGGKGLFVKEIEEALFQKDVDLAVHSMKDVPGELPAGLTLCGIPKRENPRDALISRGNLALEDLPESAGVGSSSLRRKAQLLCVRPDLDVVPLRGNVDPRRAKLAAGEIYALVLPAAGLTRLGLAGRISHVLSEEDMLPAIGQGALGLEIREDDDSIRDVLGFLNHRETEIAVSSERAFLKELEGGCQVPIAALGGLENGILHLEGMVAELDGSRFIREEMSGPADKPEELGRTLARRLLSQGADRILDGIYGRESSRGGS